MSAGTEENVNALSRLKAELAENQPKKCSISLSSWCQKTFGAMLNDPSTHDVTFKTSDGGSVSGHRAIVAAGSPVFHAMLYGNMKESNEKEIKLSSIDSETLKVLLTFLYTGKATFDINRCMKLLEAANYFVVGMLEVRCVGCINDTLNIENCCQIATEAHDKGLKLLLEKCFSFMFINAIEVIKSPQFKDIPFEILLTFLESTDIHAPELGLFLAVVEWYKHQNGQFSDITKSIFRSIRYPLISKHDLICTVKKVKEIDSALYVAALEYHLEPEEYSGPLEQITPRQPCFEVISVTPDTVELERTKNEVTILRVGPYDQKGLCAVKVCPLKQKPVCFRLCLKSKIYNLNVIQFALQCTTIDDLDTQGIHYGGGGTNAKCFKHTEEIEVSVTLSGSDEGATAKIGSQLLYAHSCKNSSYFLCIYLYNSGDKLVISKSRLQLKDDLLIY